MAWLDRHESCVSSVAFGGSDRQWVVSGSDDKTVQVWEWDARTGQAGRWFLYYMLLLGFVKSHNCSLSFL